MADAGTPASWCLSHGPENPFHPEQPGQSAPVVHAESLPLPPGFPARYTQSRRPVGGGVCHERTASSLRTRDDRWPLGALAAGGTRAGNLHAKPIQNQTRMAPTVATALPTTADRPRLVFASSSIGMSVGTNLGTTVVVPSNAQQRIRRSVFWKRNRHRIAATLPIRGGDDAAPVAQSRLVVVKPWELLLDDRWDAVPFAAGDS